MVLLVRWFTHWKWWFSIAMLVYQRGLHTFSCHELVGCFFFYPYRISTFWAKWPKTDRPIFEPAARTYEKSRVHRKIKFLLSESSTLGGCCCLHCLRSLPTHTRRMIQLEGDGFHGSKPVPYSDILWIPMCQPFWPLRNMRISWGNVVG